MVGESIFVCFYLVRYFARTVASCARVTFAVRSKVVARVPRVTLVFAAK